MASHLAMESLIKNLKKHVESSICLDDFTKPKTIACPASQFLRECLKKHTLMRQRDGQLRCPNARHKWPSPKETDSISYRPDFFITAYSVFSQFNKVAIVVGSAADFGTKTERRNNLPYCFDCEKFPCSWLCKRSRAVYRWPVRRTQLNAHQTVLSIRLGRFPKAKEILHREAPQEGSKQILLSHLPNFYLSNILKMNHKTHEIKLLEAAAGH